MRRWNGWGDEATTYLLPEAAGLFLANAIGHASLISDAKLEQVLASVPESRLAPHRLVSTDAEQRLRHARGQSLPDWIALRSGRIDCFPDGVAFPASDSDVRELLGYARVAEAIVVPFGGGTSVAGHINPVPTWGPVLTVDMSHMNQLLKWDETSQLATLGAGASGPQIEAALRNLGFTLGHYPQSWEFSTLGGWVAARSCGQQSYYYGRIENLFAGGHVETPLGSLDLPPLPASAAGPDVRQLVLGSEGRLGIVTRATVRVRRLPEAEDFGAALFRDWESGVQAVRHLAQSRARVSMLRLSDAQETETTLILSGKEHLVHWAERGLRVAGFGSEKCLLIFGVTGERGANDLARRQVFATCVAHGGLPVPFIVGRMWRKTRFLTPYLRNTLWERGYATDTLETAVPWSEVVSTAAAIKSVMQQALAAFDERLLVFAHLSHVYPDGASIYVTFIFRRTADPDEMLARWQKVKEAASLVIVGEGGTISHQHGVGMDHAPYLPAEKGGLGMAALKQACRALDPEGMMNRGKLFEG